MNMDLIMSIDISSTPNYCARRFLA